jgi:GNAT acetyltransferase-like protein
MSAPFHFTMRREMGCKAWDALADASDEAWLWHRYDLQDAFETWLGRTDESFALTAPDGEQPLALVPLRSIARRVAGLLPMHVLECFGGVALRNGLGEKRRRAVLMAVRDRLVTRARKGICLEARVSLPAMAPAFRGAANPRVNPLLEMGCDNTLTQTWVVDLGSGREKAWKQMEGRARTAVRKAEKAGVTVREARQDDLHIYYHLHQQTYRRTGVPPHPKDYFRVIWDRILSKGLARVWIAELDGEPVAAENFGIYKRAAIYWTGAASAKGLEVEANSLLQWTAMQWMLNNGIEWYETGEAFPQLGAGKYKGISDFKKSFGGCLYPYYKGRLPLGTVWEGLYQCVRGRQ